MQRIVTAASEFRFRRTQRLIDMRNFSPRPLLQVGFEFRRKRHPFVAAFNKLLALEDKYGSTRSFRMHVIRRFDNNAVLSRSSLNVFGHFKHIFYGHQTARQ